MFHESVVCFGDCGVDLSSDVSHQLCYGLSEWAFGYYFTESGLPRMGGIFCCEMFFGFLFCFLFFF